MVKPEFIHGAMAESQQELTHQLTAVRAQLQQVVLFMAEFSMQLKFGISLLRITKTRDIDERLRGRFYTRACI